MAQKMIDDQSREIDQEAATGHEFDIAWTEIVAKHHAGAIRMSNDQIRNGANAGLKEIAREIRDKQTRERKQLLAKHEQLESGHSSTISSGSDRRRMAKTEPRYHRQRRGTGAALRKRSERQESQSAWAAADLTPTDSCREDNDENLRAGSADRHVFDRMPKN